MILLLCAIHRQPITITMTCSVCHQKGHNKRTCELNTKVATTGKYAGLTAVQIEAIFAERERKNYEELVAPIIAPKLACADCGQVETECHLEITEQGKTLCCDCLYPENPTEYEEDDDETVSVVSEDTCECCGRPYDHRNPHRQSEMCDCVQNDDGTLSRPEVSICEACGVPETDECRPDCAYQARRQREEEEEHRQKTVCGEEEDSDEDLEVECEGCGGKFHDDDTLSTRYNRKYCEDCWENVPKELHPYIEGLDEEEDSDDESVCECCKCEMLSDGKGNPDSKSQFYEELGEWYCGRCYEYYTRPSPTRDQLIALGKYKLAKFQIGKQDQRDETNWNEDGDDELCSAIDASGNALY